MFKKLDTSIIIGAIVLAILIYSIIAYCKKMWPFNEEYYRQNVCQDKSSPTCSCKYIKELGRSVKNCCCGTKCFPPTPC